MTSATKVLIVEDEPWLASSQKRILEKEKYDVHVAPHALAAIRDIDEFHPDVLILDILLTGSTGFALLHELQSYHDTGKLPVIISTTIASDLKLDDLAPYGVKRILDKATAKPIDLIAAVRSVV